MRHSALLPLAILVAALACDTGASASKDGDTTGGSLVAGVQTDVVSVLPPTIRQVDQRLVADQIFEPLAWIGDEGRIDGGFRPALADRWNWEGDSTVLVFHLNPRARWHDGVPVRASDVRFTHQLYTDTLVASLEREALIRIDSVTVRDSVTAVFWFASRYPDQMYDAAVRMLILPEHLLGKEPRATLQTSAFGRNPIGSGRFRVAKWDPATAIELVTDTGHYRGRAKVDRLVFSVTPDQNALATRLQLGEIDAAEVVSSEHFRALSSKPEYNTHVLPALDYAFLQFNLRDPKRRGQAHALFGDAELRRALTMALDRNRLVRSQFDTLATVSLGPMTRAQALADTTIASIPYDSAGAARLLDSLGWTLPAGKSVRERAGRPLRFEVIVPSISRNRRAMVVRMQEALRGIGADMTVAEIEPNVFVGRLMKRNFDAAFNGTRAEVSLAGLRPYWSTAAAMDPSGMNFGSYQNARFDAHLDSALASHSMDEARAHAAQAFRTIVADAPAVWMYEMRSAPVIHRRIRTAHIVPGAWWQGIADWTIPPAERIDRDRVGLAARPQ